MDTKTQQPNNGTPTQAAPPAQLAPAAIAIAPKAPIQFVPANIDEMYRMAKMLAVSSLLPPDLVGKVENVMLVLMMGNELGLTAVQALRQIYVVKGKPYISAALKLALVKRAPECIKFQCIETSAERATFECQRVGEDPTKLSFTIEQAKRAGLTSKGGNWEMYPDVMLRWRAASHLADLVFPDIVGNVGAKEDLNPDDLPSGGFLERVVPEVTAPPPPPPLSAQAGLPQQPAAQTSPPPGDASKSSSPDAAEVSPAAEVVPPKESKPMAVEDAPADPIDVEVATIRKGLAEAPNRREAQKLIPRIQALPANERLEMTRAYEEAVKAKPAR